MMNTSPHAFPGLFMLLMPIVVIIGLALFAFWVWMLVDCLTNQGLVGNEKIVWVLVIALTHWLGALIYLFIGRPKRPPAGMLPPPT